MYVLQIESKILIEQKHSKKLFVVHQHYVKLKKLLATIPLALLTSLFFLIPPISVKMTLAWSLLPTNNTMLLEKD